MSRRPDVAFLAGTEGLTGFVLITWSASFTYWECSASGAIRNTAQIETRLRLE
jgi:hypothetical protein